MIKKYPEKRTYGWHNGRRRAGNDGDCRITVERDDSLIMSQLFFHKVCRNFSYRCYYIRQKADQKKDHYYMGSSRIEQDLQDDEVN